MRAPVFFNPRRLELALELGKAFPEVPIIASGGGRTFASESGAMIPFLVEHGVRPGRIHQEDLSLDTLGNAVFSKLVAREGKLPASRILVVTSAFHGPRSLFLFRKVFGPGHAVAVALAKTPADAAALDRQVESEIAGLSTVARNMLNLDPGGGAANPSGARGGGLEGLEGLEGLAGLEGDECGILTQMLLEHEIYKYRWDIARRFHEYLGPSLPSRVPGSVKMKE